MSQPNSWRRTPLGPVGREITRQDEQDEGGDEAQDRPLGRVDDGQPVLAPDANDVLAVREQALRVVSHGVRALLMPAGALGRRPP